MPAPQTLRFALYCTGCIPGYHLPCFAGSARQIYRQHGLSVEIVDPEPGPENVLAVAAGRYDLCLTSVAHFLNAKLQQPGLEARFVFMLARQSHMAAFVVQDRVAHHGRTITNHGDLAGASLLGECDSAFVREYLTCLHRLGIPPGPVIPTPYGEIMQELIEGRADVAADFVDLFPRFEAAAASTGVQIRALPFHEAGLDIYGSGLVAGCQLLEDRPATVRTAAKAFRDAVIASHDDPGTGLAELLKHIPTADPDEVLAGWEVGSSLIFDDEAPLGGMSDEKWRRTIEFHADAYGTSRELDPRDVFVQSKVDADPLKVG